MLFKGAAAVLIACERQSVSVSDSALQHQDKNRPSMKTSWSRCLSIRAGIFQLVSFWEEK